MPKGTSPVEGDKLKSKRRRSAKPKVPSQPIVSAPASAPVSTARFVKVQKKSSWFWSMMQVLFAVAVIIGAYFLFHQMQKVREEAKKREDILQQQLKEQVEGVQDKFDALIDTLQKQKTDELSVTARVDYSIVGTPVRGSYLVRLGDLSQTDQKHVFSANPDVWGEIGVEADSCARPLVIGDFGYCDVFEIDGLPAIERVSVETNDADEIVRVLKMVSVEYADDQTFRWTVDLGTPVVEGRDVFAPVDAEAQQESLSAYLRALLKHEALPEVLAENLNAFDDIIEHLRLRP